MPAGERWRRRWPLGTHRIDTSSRCIGPLTAAYLPGDRTSGCRGYGIMVITIAGGQIATITGFPDPALFPVFGLPLTYP